MSENSLIARQSIVDKEQKTFGYEIFSRSATGGTDSTTDNTVETDSKQLFNILSTFGMDTLLEGKNAFLNCILEDNPLEYFDLISPRNVILEVQPLKMETEEVIRKVAEKIQVLKIKGYKIATNEIVLSKKYESWVKFVDFIKIDSSKYQDNIITAIINKAKTLNKKLVIEKIETMEKFTFFHKLNVDFFQGFFFCKPVLMNAKLTNPSTIAIVKLINLTMQQAEIREIEECLKTDPTLSFKLLKYMNSYGVAGGIKIDSFNKAIMVLGYKSLLKWLSILFTTTNQTASADLLTKTALIRGRFMENLASKVKTEEVLPVSFKDNSFVVGLFSLLDAMLNITVESVFNTITAPEDVANAILHEKGPLSDLLKMVKALECNEWIDVFSYAYKFNLTESQINESYLEAITWSKGLGM